MELLKSMGLPIVAMFLGVKTDILRALWDKVVAAILAVQDAVQYAEENGVLPRKAVIEKLKEVELPLEVSPAQKNDLADRLANVGESGGG